MNDSLYDMIVRISERHLELAREWTWCEKFERLQSKLKRWSWISRKRREALHALRAVHQQWHDVKFPDGYGSYPRIVAMVDDYLRAEKADSSTEVTEGGR